MSINAIGGNMPLSPQRTDIDGVLAQIRSMRSRASSETLHLGLAADKPVGSTTAEPGFTSFTDKLKSALDNVNALQKDASARTQDFAAGRNNDLVGTMLAMQKSDVAFQATMQVRNRLVSAYQDIMNMPI
jgi:flagellar hook-basal body complex protein FliE